MFQTHCYDAWLGGTARGSSFFMWSQLGGTFPAPLFLFLAGISVALVVDKLRAKGLSVAVIGKKIIRRGAEIFVLGLLFRLQEFAISLGWAPWSDLFRVDILNTIGVSIMLMGVMCWGALALIGRGGTPQQTEGAPSLSPRSLRRQGGDFEFPKTLRSLISSSNSATLTGIAIATSAAISAFTPLLWTTWRPHFLPWEVETYINGVHNLGKPQAWLFPIFPWTAFAFAGLALGFLLVSDFAKHLGSRFFVLTGLSGMGLIALSKFLDSRSLQLYPVYDYWHTSPNFFLIRIGMLLILVLLAYAWCRWGAGQWGFSPLIQLGWTSLLVYWVHIEFVYGRFSILPRRRQSVSGASKGLLVIFVSMLLLSLARTTWKTHVPRLWTSRTSRKPAHPVTSA